MSNPKHLPLPSTLYAPDEVLIPTEDDSYHQAAEWYYHSAYVLETCYIAKDKNQITVDSTKTRPGLTSSLHGPFDFEVYANLPADEHFTLVGIADLECWVVGNILGTLRAQGKDAILLHKCTADRIDKPEERRRLGRMNLGHKCLICYWDPGRPASMY